MAFLVLLFIGVMVGWFASIVARDEAVGSIRLQIVLSALAALGCGLFMNGWAVLGSLQWAALGAGLGASLLVAALYNLIFNRGSSQA